jgi:hypothetical protein
MDRENSDTSAHVFHLTSMVVLVNVRGITFFLLEIIIFN